MISHVTWPPAAAPARRLAARIRAAGGEAWIIGGAVRDLCLGALPKDFDVATSLRPEALLDLFPGANETGKSFGVLRVRLDESEVEVASFRRDGPYSDGRRPDYVEFTSLEEDIRRRDFTINALAADPESGEIVDRVAGRDDLTAGLVRAVGDPEARFAEDRLRLIRAARFAHRLGFRIEETTRAAIIRRATEIDDVAKERIADELTRILRHAPAGRGVLLLDELGLLAPLLPEIVAMKGVEQPAEFHPEGDVFVHTILTLDALAPGASAAAAWAALLHDIGKPATFFVTDRIRFHGHAELGARMTERIGRRFRLSNALIERVQEIILDHMKFGNIDRMRRGRLLNWASRPHFEELLEVHRADCAASHLDMSAHAAATAALEELRRLEAMPPKIVTGELLIAMGLTPGPGFKRIIESAYEAQLEGIISDIDGGRRFVSLSAKNLLSSEGCSADSDTAEDQTARRGASGVTDEF
jgi:poly(A) polymerase